MAHADHGSEAVSARIWKYRRNKIRTVTACDGRLLKKTDKLRASGSISPLIPGLDALMAKMWDAYPGQPF